jgi:pyruvate kinase
MQRFAKIVCTLGPSSNTKEIIRDLVTAGMNVARLNFSHGTHEAHSEKIDLLREVSTEMGVPITILQDLQGPKLRIGILPEGGVDLKAGDFVKLSSSEKFIPDNADIFIPFEIPELHKCLQPGNHILLDDGHLELEVKAINGERIDAIVILGGLLKSNKGVNLPGANLSTPIFTEKDHEDLKFGLHKGVDLVAISFVRCADDILTIRKAIDDLIKKQTGRKDPDHRKIGTTRSSGRS